MTCATPARSFGYINCWITVIFFDQSSRGDTRSPAYLQLQRTIAEIQTVIEELEADNR